MPIEFKEGVRYIGIFFVEWPNFGNVDAGNLLLALWEEDGRAKFKYRFRYFRDEKVFDSQDVRNWYEADGQLAPDGELMAKFTMVCKMIAGVSEAEVADAIYINGDAEAAMRALLNAEWAHARAEEVELGGDR